MEQHYSAFISYRHHPDDIKTAEQIQRALERFSVPKAIRQRCGKIDRLFRDKDELPITSNLTGNITQALKNADYLIVICSEHTAESVWVQREIELFLTTHSKSRVLTVLSGGEPQDTIPKILQTDTVTDPVTGKHTLVSIEPLSCDWRVDRRKAMREELPRLAAALLGCGYDELRQRQRQYRMRRLVACFSAALALSLCLTGYFVYTSLRIQNANRQLSQANDRIQQANEDLENANQQILQANEQIQSNLDKALLAQSQFLASSALERLAAGDRLTAITLAKEALCGGPRPYWAEAELALSQALGAYTAVPSISAQAAFTADATVRQFQVTPDGNTVYIADAQDTVTCWDSHSFQKLGTVFAQGLLEMAVTDAGDLLLHHGPGLQCFRPDGSLLWTWEDCRDAVFRSDGKLLVLGLNEHKIWALDPATGMPDEPAVSVPQLNGEAAVSFQAEQYPSGSSLTLRYPTALYGYYALCTLEPTTGAFTQIFETNNTIFAQSFDDQGNLLLLVSDGTGMNNGRIGELWYAEPVGLNLYAITPAGDILWQQHFESYFYASCITLSPIPESDRVLCQYANDFWVLDNQGNITGYGRATDLPVCAYVEKAEVWGVLQDGSIFFYSYADTVYSMDYLLDGITCAQVKDAYYVATDTNQVIAYRNLSDTPAASFSEPLNGSVRESRVYEDRLIALTYDSVYCYSLTDLSLAWSAEIAGSTSLLTFQDGKLWLLEGRNQVIAIDLSSGKPETWTLPAQMEDSSGSIYTVPRCFGDTLYYTVTDYTTLCSATWTLGTQQYTLGSALPVEKHQFLSPKMLLCADGSVLEDGDPTGLTLTGTPVSFLAQDGTIALGAGSDLAVFAQDGLTRFSCDDRTVCSLYLAENHLFVLCTDATLLRYDLTGKLLASTQLPLSGLTYSQLSSTTEWHRIRWQLTGDGDLLVIPYNTASVIELESFRVRACFTGCLGYDGGSDSFLVRGTDVMVRFPRYTTGQLLDKATEALGAYELSPAQKEQYGLS